MALRQLQKFSQARGCQYSRAFSATLEPWRRGTKLNSEINRSYSATGESASLSIEESNPLPPKLVVFGGRGFVGSAVCKEAVSSGLHVVSISPSGSPPIKQLPWTKEVEWLKGCALEPSSYSQYLEGAVAAISCIGGFGNQEQMMKVNGSANMTAIQTCATAGIPRFVFISAHIPPIPGIDMLLKGYVQGKADTEATLRSLYPRGGVALRPGFIYGERVVSTSTTLPLQMVGAPMEAVLAKLPFNTRTAASIPFVGAVMVPPVNVESVARAAVRAATDPSIPAGVMDVWQIAEYK